MVVIELVVIFFLFDMNILKFKTFAL